MRKRKLHIAVSAALAAAFIGGCGSDQDSGTGNPGDAVSGIVADGYIARAVVYVDLNEDNTLDYNEPRALTDDDGYFSTAKDGTDYCASTATEEQEIYCLRIPDGVDGSVMLRMVGGYDISTALPFYGTLSRQVSDASEVAYSSPITALLANMSAEDQAAFAAAEGISLDDLTSTDFLQFGGTNAAVVNELVHLAFVLQRTVDIIGHNVENKYDGFGETDDDDDDSNDMPENAGEIVYRAIAAELAATYDATAVIAQRQIRTVLTNATSVGNILDAVETELGNSGATVLPANMADRIEQLITMLDTLFGSGVADEEEFKSRSRAVEIAAKLMRKEAYNPASQEATTATVDLVSDLDYLEKLADDKTDIDDLSQLIESGEVTDASAIDYSAREPLPENPIGAVLAIEDEESEDRGDGEKNSVSFNFLSASGSDTPGDSEEEVSSGKLELVVDYKGDDEEDSLESTAEDPIEGTWTKLDDYSMLLNLEIAGTTEPVIMKRNSDGSGYKFDFGDGELKEWIPKAGQDFQFPIN